MMRNVLVAAILVMAPMSSWANMILDNFDSGTVAYLGPVGGVGNPLASGSNSGLWAWGGTRRWEITVTQAGSSRTALDIYPLLIFEEAIWSNGPQVQGHLHLEYGSYAGAGNQNADWTDVYGLVVTAVAIDAGTGILTTDIEVNGTTYSSNTPITITGSFAGPGVQEYVVPLSSFGLPSLADIDGVRYTFTTQSQGWDITLGSVGLTPEPTSLTLLGLGLLALVRRRRRK